MLTMFRQGDQLFREVTGLDLSEATRQVVTGYVVALGEVTGHAHVIEQEVTVLTWQGGRYVSSAEPVTVTHEEHAPVTIPAGTFQIVQQQQYTPEEVRPIID